MINGNDEGIRGGCMCLESAGIGVDASAKADAETLADFDYMIDGIIYTLTSGDGDIKLDDETVEDGYTAIFLAQADTAGAITVVKGTEVSNTDITNGNAVLDWPTPTNGKCPFGALKIKNASGSQFVGGTTEQDASGITTTYYNLGLVPVEPLTS